MKRTTVIAFALASLALLVLSTGCWEPLCPAGEEPVAVIDQPTLQGPGVQTYGWTVMFQWHCEPLCRPIYVRYLYCQVTDPDGVYDPDFDIIRDLNENPWRYEDRWSAWIPYTAPDNSGRYTVVPDGAKGITGDNDRLLEPGRVYIFAVQARSYGRNITRTFELNENVRLFITYDEPSPYLTLTNPYLGSYVYVQTSKSPSVIDLPPGVPISFSWKADASHYGGEIVCYRYGWDVEDITDPDDWAVECSIDCRAVPETTFYDGPHILYIEAFDDDNRSILVMLQVGR